jgi:dTDP-4-dehydrorhamnose reductase
VTGGAGLVAGGLVLGAPPHVTLSVTERRTPVPPQVAKRAEVHRVDLADPDEVLALLRRLRPSVVVHTAYTQDRRRDIVDATASVAGAVARTGASLVHLSTDVVFGGDHPPYDEDDPPDPVSDYGRWKAEAEDAARASVADVAITRTSLVVSLGPPDRSTAWLLSSLRAGTPPRLFRDEWRQPIRLRDLVRELWALVDVDRTERAGVWHLPGPERLSRLELGRRLAAAAGLDPSAIVPATRAEHPAPRPADPRLLARRRLRLGLPPSPVGRDAESAVTGD